MCVAPNRIDMFRRTATGSTPTMIDAPRSLRSERGAQSDGTLREHRDGVTDLHVAALRAGDSRRRDVGHHQDLLVGERIGNPGEVRARVRHEQVLRPRAVDRVAEAPSSERTAALGARVIEAVEALATRRDRPDDHAVSDRVLVVETLAERIDDADRLVAEDQARTDRVFAFDDVHVGAADGCGGDADDGFARPAGAASALLRSAGR